MDVHLSGVYLHYVRLWVPLFILRLLLLLSLLLLWIGVSHVYSGCTLCWLDKVARNHNLFLLFLSLWIITRIKEQVLLCIRGLLLELIPLLRYPLLLLRGVVLLLLLNG